MSAPVCPECAAGKCGNCCGEALDEAQDAIVDCACPACQTPEPCCLGYVTSGGDDRCHEPHCHDPRPAAEDV